jgi:bZIP factor
MVHRRKNNLAAKRSRDARRSKEDEIAIRAALLEQENLQLKWEMARLRTETGRLRELLLAEDTEESASGELSLGI